MVKGGQWSRSVHSFKPAHTELPKGPSTDKGGSTRVTGGKRGHTKSPLRVVAISAIPQPHPCTPAALSLMSVTLTTQYEHDLGLRKWMGDAEIQGEYNTKGMDSRNERPIVKNKKGKVNKSINRLSPGRRTSLLSLCVVWKKHRFS